jgi:hypothetical protein
MGLEFRKGQESFLFSKGSETHPASFPGLERPGREVNRSPPSIAEVKNEWVYTSTPPIYLRRVDRESFIIIIIINYCITHITLALSDGV